MSGGILSGPELQRAIRDGEITITPFDESHVNRVNPASYDLTLGPKIAVYRDVVNADFSVPPGDVMRNPEKGATPGCLVTPHTGFNNLIDAAKKNDVVEYEMDERGFLLRPGIGYLMHTAERVHTDKYVPIIDGKSSIGRLFAFVHVSAGYGDPGFDGQYTLEVIVTHPLIVYAGMRFCQMRFHTIVGEVKNYRDTGSYKGNLAEGPIPSQSYKMFNK